MNVIYIPLFTEFPQPSLGKTVFARNCIVSNVYKALDAGLKELFEKRVD